jgi:hypothetical protein
MQRIAPAVKHPRSKPSLRSYQQLDTLPRVNGRQFGGVSAIHRDCQGPSRMPFCMTERVGDSDGWLSFTQIGGAH